MDIGYRVNKGGSISIVTEMCLLILFQAESVSDCFALFPWNKKMGKKQAACLYHTDEGALCKACNLSDGLEVRTYSLRL